MAGFLEAGETLEECVEREVFEETGLKVKNITYFSNQPWPYPSGLMVGFIADYESGEIKLQEDEPDRCRLLFQRQPARNSTKTEYRKKATDRWRTIKN